MSSKSKNTKHDINNNAKYGFLRAQMNTPTFQHDTAH